MKVAILLLFSISVTSQLFSQESSSNDVFVQVTSGGGAGKVIIHQDPAIKQLVSGHISSNGESSVMEGFRIQLYSGSSKKAKTDALAAKGKFLSIFPDIPVYLEYNAPFWRVRAGDFRSKNESMELYSKLKSFFPESYPVKDPNVNYTRIAEPMQ